MPQEYFDENAPHLTDLAANRQQNFAVRILRNLSLDFIVVMGINAMKCLRNILMKMLPI